MLKIFSRFQKISVFLFLIGFAVSLSGCSNSDNSQNKARSNSRKGQANVANRLNPNLPDQLIPANHAPAAPYWELAGLDGKARKLPDFRGKIVILDFWDTWCPPCRKEIPGFIELQKQYGSQGLVVLGAAFGRDGREAVQKFADEIGINYTTLFANRKIAMDYGGINSIPTTFLIDSQGRVRSKHVGYVPKNIFETQVRQLLEEL